MGSVFLAALALATPVHADLAKCQLGIGKYGAKLDGKLLKGLQKCTDFYRKAQAKGTPVADAAAACELQLAKAAKFPDIVSAMGATKAGLDLLASGGTCTDDDLRALGHLPTVPFGDTWSRSILVARLGAAYALQLGLTRDTDAIFRALDAAGGCPLCAALVKSPCVTHTCRLSAGTSSVEIRTGPGLPLTTPVLTGQLTLDLCRADNVLPGDYVATAGPTKTLREGSVLGATACVSVHGIHGYVTCGASAPRIATATCQDHVVAPTPEVDDCAAAGFTTCGPATPDLIDGDPSGGPNTHVGATNGGACLQLTTSAASAGDALLLATLQVTLVRPGQLGPDGIACTADDTATPGLPITLPLTTATAQASVFDSNDLPGSDFTTPVITGTRFGCNNIQAGIMPPGKLVGAIPALHGVCTSPPCDNAATAADEGSIPSDGTMSFTVTCQ